MTHGSGARHQYTSSVVIFMDADNTGAIRNAWSCFCPLLLQHSTEVGTFSSTQHELKATSFNQTDKLWTKNCSLTLTHGIGKQILNTGIIKYICYTIPAAQCARSHSGADGVWNCAWRYLVARRPLNNSYKFHGARSLFSLLWAC